MVELGTHAPLAAIAAPASEGEQTLAGKLWEKVPEHSLMIGDRLFGTAYTLWQALNAWQGRDITFLVRIRDNIKAEVLQRLADGSALVRVPVREAGRKVDNLQVREICATGVALNGKRFKLRLWTTLLDPKRYPAETLARHYAERWEHELYYRELKLDVRNAPILASHTLETALQEIAAVVLASAVIAQLRVASAEEIKIPPSPREFLQADVGDSQPVGYLGDDGRAAYSCAASPCLRALPGHGSSHRRVARAQSTLLSACTQTAPLLLATQNQSAFPHRRGPDQSGTCLSYTLSAALADPCLTGIAIR